MRSKYTSLYKEKKGVNKITNSSNRLANWRVQTRSSTMRNIRKLSQEIKVALDLDCRINTGDEIISETKELSGEKSSTSSQISYKNRVSEH